MTNARRLKDSLHSFALTRIIGAHNPLSARLGAEAGFDAIWAGGLEISASQAVPDANILTMTEVLAVASAMAEAVDVPILADCDTGFGGAGNVVHMVRQYEARGIAGVCMEDKHFPKLNSFVPGTHDLVPAEEFAAKIRCAKDAACNRDFVVVARLESLISGQGLTDALFRATAYEDAGADALLIHSKKSSPEEVFEFRDRYTGDLPVVVVPTTYPGVTIGELTSRHFGAVIYANHSLRSSIRAMKDTLAKIRKSGTTLTIETEIASLAEVFTLQDTAKLLETQKRHEQNVLRYRSADLERR